MTEEEAIRFNTVVQYIETNFQYLKKDGVFYFDADDITQCYFKGELAPYSMRSWLEALKRLGMIEYEVIPSEF